MDKFQKKPKYQTLLKEADLFRDVTNDDQYIEAQILREHQSERERLIRDKELVEQKIRDFGEWIKGEKARRKFVDKRDFLLIETLEERKRFIEKLVVVLESGNIEELERAIDSERWKIYLSGKYLSFGKQELDILYDYNQQHTYNKLKENVNSQGNDEGFRQLKIKRDNWLQLRSDKRGSDCCDD